MTIVARLDPRFLGETAVDRAFWYAALFAEAADCPTPAALRRAVSAVAEQRNRYTGETRYRVYRGAEWTDVERPGRNEPRAVYLYNEQLHADVLCLDLDPKDGLTSADVAREAVKLTQLLERIGLRWIADLSDRGGVHVLIRLDQQRRWEELRELQLRLCDRFQTIDKSVMTGRAAMLTMPGSPCKPNGDGPITYRRLLGPDASARLQLWLSGPSSAASWTALRATLGLPAEFSLFTTDPKEGIHAAAPGGSGLPEGSPIALPTAELPDAPDPSSCVPVVDADATDPDAACPVRRWPVQKVLVLSPDAVPASVAELAATGVHHSGDRSRGAWAVVCACIEAGWTKEAWLARVTTWPELAGYRKLRGHKAHTLVDAAAAEWDRAWGKGHRPPAGSKAVHLVSGEVRLPVDVGTWVGAAYEVLEAAWDSKAVRIDAAANVRALVEALARVAAKRGVEFPQALRGLGVVAGLPFATVKHARDWLRAQGLLITYAQRPDLTRRDVGEDDWTRWTLVVPDDATAESVSVVPILEPLWAALGWVHRDVWTAVWRVGSLGELAAELGIGNRSTLSGYLARLADVGLYRPVPRKLGTAVPLMELDDVAYEALCGEWRTVSEQLRADRWEAMMARQREVGAAETVRGLREEPAVAAAWRARAEAREALVDLEAHAGRLAEWGEVLDLTDVRLHLTAAEAQLEAAIAGVERDRHTDAVRVSGVRDDERSLAGR